MTTLNTESKSEIRYLLFVIDQSPKSQQAQKNLAKICPSDQVQVIDITKNPMEAQKYGVFATPTVIRAFDSLTIIGTLDDLERVASMLGLPYKQVKEGGKGV